MFQLFSLFQDRRNKYEKGVNRKQAEAAERGHDEDAAERDRPTRVHIAEVRTDAYCSPSHQIHFESSFLELIAIL